jgi:hypothetical protein
MSALAMCSLKAPALLAFAQERAEGHVPTLDGLERVPCDTHLRAILAPVSPQGLRPRCKRRWRQRQRGPALEALTFLAGHALGALAGTESFASKTIHCASC